MKNWMPSHWAGIQIMQRQILTTFITAALIATLTAIATSAPPALGRSLFKSSKAIVWQPNLQTAHRHAIAENKPIMIVFGADWCGFCTKLEKQTLSSPDVAQYVNDNFVSLHLDFDKEKRIREILEVESIPCIVVLSPNADLLGRISGFKTAAPLQLELAKSMQLYRGYQIQPAAGKAN
jgi:thiol:disulfide interchange protein